MTVAEADDRILGVIVAGSVAAGLADEHSDLDLVIVCADDAAGEVLADGRAIAERIGPVLAAFTGEHVGEPRLLIVLYGPTPLHVDLKFVGAGDLDDHARAGLVLWQRGDVLTRAFGASVGPASATDAQWIEDRFWVWVHYTAGRLNRGEIFEALDALATLRRLALAPLITRDRAPDAIGVRRIEQIAPEYVEPLGKTIGGRTPEECWGALEAAMTLYRRLRENLPVDVRVAAESATTGYVGASRARS